MNCFSRARTVKDQRKELQRLEEILFLINHLHLCRAKWVNSTRNLNLANLVGKYLKYVKSFWFLVVKAVPEEINYSNVKYNVEQQSSVELINESDVPAAIKVRKLWNIFSQNYFLDQKYRCKYIPSDTRLPNNRARREITCANNKNAFCTQI